MKKLHLILLLFVSVNAFGQVPLIPYHDGKKWGLADTLGLVKVEPVYDTVEIPTYATRSHIEQYEAKDMFIVKSAGKYGLLKHADILMPVKYIGISVDSDFIRAKVKLSSGMQTSLIYDLEGKLFIPDSNLYIRPITDKANHNHLYGLSDNDVLQNNGGVFWYDPQHQKAVQWIVKDVNRVEIGYSSKGDIQLGLITTKSTGPYTSTQVVTYNQLKFDQTTRKYILTEIPERPKDGVTDIDFVRASLPKETIPNNNFLIRNIIFKLTGKEVKAEISNQRLYDRFSKKDTVVYKPDCDSMELKKYTNILKRHQTFPVIFDKTTPRIDTGIAYENYVLLKKGGKLGLIAENVIIPPVYHSISYIDNDALERPCFQVSMLMADGKLKWGVINSQNKAILPCVYDDLIISRYFAKYYIIKKDNLYGLVDIHGKTVLPLIYDGISQGKYYKSFGIELKGKYGYFTTDEREVNCKPMFPNKVKQCVNFGKYTVFELVNDNNKLIGYADKKGFLYFKN